MPSLYQRYGSQDSKLSSQRLTGAGSRGGKPGGLNPTLLSYAGAASGRAPRIGNVAGVQYSPVPTQKIAPTVLETALGAGVNLGQTWVQAANQYKNRENQVFADKAVNSFETFSRRLVHGGATDQGEIVKGYDSTVGLDSKPAFDAGLEQLNKQHQAALDGLTEAQKMKAISRMSKIKDAAIYRMAKHRTEQLEVAKQEELFLEGENIQKGAAATGDFEGAVQKLIQFSYKFETPEEQRNALTNGYSQILDTFARIKKEEPGITPDIVHAEQRAMFERHKSALPVATVNKIDSQLDQQAITLANSKEERDKKYIKRLQSAFEVNRPGPVANSLLSAEEMKSMKIVYGEVAQYYENDPKAGEAALYNVFTRALSIINSDPKLGYDRATVAWDEYNKYMAANPDERMSIGLQDKITDYVNGKLRAEADKTQLKNLNNFRTAITIKLRDAKTLKDVDALTPLIDLIPDPTHHKTAITYQGIRIKDIKGEISDQQKVKQGLELENFKEKVEEQGFTPEIRDTVQQEVLVEGLPFGAEEVLVKHNKNYGPLALPLDYKTVVDYFKAVDVDPYKRFVVDQSDNSVLAVSGLPSIVSQQLVRNMKDTEKSDAEWTSTIKNLWKEQYRDWRKLDENKNKTAQNWIDDYFTESPEIKAGFMSTLLSLPLGGIGALDVGEYRKPIEEAQGYQWVTRKPQGETITQGTGLTAKQVPRTRREEVPIGAGKPTTLEERVRLWIPNEINGIAVDLKGKFAGKSTDYMLALKYLANGANSDMIYGMPEMHDIDIRVKAIQQKSGFIEWAKYQKIGIDNSNIQ